MSSGLWITLVVSFVSALLGAIAVYRFGKKYHRAMYERDCYRTALHVLELNGYFDHKAEELVRQHTPE